MTIEELKASDKLYVYSTDIEQILNVTAQSIRDTAHQFPGALGFPVCVVGNKTLIPRKPFINFWEGTTT